MPNKTTVLGSFTNTDGAKVEIIKTKDGNFCRVAGEVVNKVDDPITFLCELVNAYVIVVNTISKSKE